MYEANQAKFGFITAKMYERPTLIHQKKLYLSFASGVSFCKSLIKHMPFI